jgi:hypothetical protein
LIQPASFVSSPGPDLFSRAASCTGYASPTDFFSVAGSSTKTIKIINIRLSGYATGNNNVPVALVKRSTANTGGTPTSITKTPWDSALRRTAPRNLCRSPDSRNAGWQSLLHVRSNYP